MRKSMLAGALVLLAVVLSPPGVAAAATKTVTISTTNPLDQSTATLNPDPVAITEGDTVTFKNVSTFSYTVCLQANTQLVTVGAGATAVTPPLASGDGYIDYYLAGGACGASGDPAASGTINVTAAPTTTSTTVKATTTTAKGTTTTSSTTTSSTTSSSTTSSTTSSTSTTLAAVTASDSGGGDGVSPVLLGAAVVVVAALAGGAYWAYRRSNEEPPFPAPPGWDEPPGGEPPTTMGPSL